jgi:hypothetical protein
MRSCLLTIFALLSLTCSVRADMVVLGTNYQSGSPLLIDPGATSGLMTINITNLSSPSTLMAGWQLDLLIVPIGPATGSLTFATPAGNPFSAPNPPNYIFGNDNLGIEGTNTGSNLTANDFYGDLGGVLVPTTGANLLQVSFSATSDASGLYGIYALEGPANTNWSDADGNTLFFQNVPNGDGMVEIGEVEVSPAPTSLTLTVLAVGTLLMFRAWKTWKSPRPEAVCL